MDKVLADTSAWVASLSRKGHEPLKKAMKESVLNGQLVTTGMVLLELLRGEKNLERYDSVRKKLSILPFISVDDSIWTEVAKLSLVLRAKGLQTSVPDLFIAHVAIKNGCVLIHCDSDFERIARHTSLKTLDYS